jgi:hypothetical protein
VSKILIPIFTLFLVGQAALGQVLVPEGSFDKDSLKIGENLEYSLSIKYPKNIDVVFPDSLFDFAPFEFTSKLSFPTRSDSIFSFDSAVYSLTTFEIDSIQILSLPIFMVTDGDSLAIIPGADSIVLVHVVESIPDSISMIPNTAYSNVRLGFNYPYWVVGVTTLVLLTILVFLIFGKAIKRKIALYRLKRKHEQFLTSFTSAIRELRSENDYIYFDHLLADWKRYMENLNRKPFTKLTTREIQIIYPDKELKESLRTIDKAIYGGFQFAELPDSFDYLRRISEDSFHTKFEEIKNG